METSYLIVKMVTGLPSIFVSPTKLFDNIEIRSVNIETTEELIALKKSATSHKICFNIEEINSSRIAIIVTADCENEALKKAENELNKLIAWEITYNVLSRSNLSKVGFLKNLKTGKISSIEAPPTKFRENPPPYTYHIQSLDEINFIAGLNGELKDRYIRSLHWAKKGREETDEQNAILFYYFASEALLKESERDNIGGILRLFMGFPNHKNYTLIKPSIIKRISNHSNYHYWEKN